MTDRSHEIARLERLLKIRSGKPGWTANVRMIEAKLQEIKVEALING